jgi:Protein of unknown function (DUF4239)
VSDWLHSLSVPWLAVLVFSGTAVLTAAIYFSVVALAHDERRRVAFKGVSPGLLPPMALVFGLLVAFLTAQVWSDSASAHAAVNREASALRAAVLLSERFPRQTEDQTRRFVRLHIDRAVRLEWPAMAEHRATLTFVPPELDSALQLALRLTPSGEGEVIAQRELVASLQDALDARRQRIIVSESRVNWVKWSGVILLAALTLIAIAFVHADNRLTAALAMGVFAAAVAVAIVMIASQERPFAGQLGVKPEPLLEVVPSGQG